MEIHGWCCAWLWKFTPGFEISLVRSSETSKNDSRTSGIPAERTTVYFWFSHKLHWFYIFQTSEWYIRTSDFYNPLARRTFNLKFRSLHSDLMLAEVFYTSPTCSCYTPNESRSYYGMAHAVSPSVNIWLSTGVTTCRFNFNFTDIIHLVRPIHDAGNGTCSSLNMYILTQLLIFTFWSFLRPFLAETKQLYEWFSPSVCLSVRHTFLTMFPSSYHHEIFRSYYQWQKWCPCKRSRSKVKVNLAVSGL